VLVVVARMTFFCPAGPPPLVKTNRDANIANRIIEANFVFISSPFAFFNLFPLFRCSALPHFVFFCAACIPSSWEKKRGGAVFVLPKSAMSFCPFAGSVSHFTNDHRSAWVHAGILRVHGDEGGCCEQGLVLLDKDDELDLLLECQKVARSMKT